MNKNHVKGGIKEASGKVREEVGHAIGNDGMTLKGVAQQIAGKVERGLGDLKDAVKDKVDHLLHPKRSNHA